MKANKPFQGAGGIIMILTLWFVLRNEPILSNLLSHREKQYRSRPFNPLIPGQPLITHLHKSDSSIFYSPPDSTTDLQTRSIYNG